MKFPLRFRCDDNTVANPRYVPHITPMWDALAERSKDAIKVARKLAKRQEG